MNRIVKLIILLSIIYINIIYGATISRNNVINTASRYIYIGEWTPKVDSTNSVSPTWYSSYRTEDNGGTPPYDKLIYCWSGFDTPEGFRILVSGVDISTAGTVEKRKRYSKFKFPARLHLL